MRCVIWKQCKVPKRRIINLIKLGLSEEEAKAISYTGKSYWNTRKSIPLHKAI